MHIPIRPLAGGLLSLALLAGCASPAPTQSLVASPLASPASTFPGALTPYRPSDTPSPTPRATAPAALPALPSPTPTPLTYTVVAKDDLSSIAYRFGVTVADLIAANPKVNPRAMSVGTVLIIPSTGKAATSATAERPTPTALPVTVSGPDCWPSAEGGLWCFALLSNPLPSPVENSLLRFRVAGSDPRAAPLERDAPGPLDLLQPGQREAVAVLFPAPAPKPERASVELLSAYPILPDDARYAPIHLSKMSVQIAPDGLSAQVSGQADIDTGSAALVWVAAAALDAQGRVVGVRRWQNAQPLQAGAPVKFSLTLYSLDGPIVSVETQAEARR